MLRLDTSPMPAEELRRLRRAIGLTQPAMAARLGYSRGASISAMERGEAPVPLCVAVVARLLRDGATTTS